MQDYSLVPGGEHTAQAFQGLTFGGNNSGIGIGLGMLQQQQQAAQTQGFLSQVHMPCPYCALWWMPAVAAALQGKVGLLKSRVETVKMLMEMEIGSLLLRALA